MFSAPDCSRIIHAAKSHKITKTDYEQRKHGQKSELREVPPSPSSSKQWYLLSVEELMANFENEKTAVDAINDCISEIQVCTPSKDQSKRTRQQQTPIGFCCSSRPRIENKNSENPCTSPVIPNNSIVGIKMRKLREREIMEEIGHRDTCIVETARRISSLKSELRRLKREIRDKDAELSALREKGEELLELAANVQFDAERIRKDEVARKKLESTIRYVESSATSWKTDREALAAIESERKKLWSRRGLARAYVLIEDFERREKLRESARSGLRRLARVHKYLLQVKKGERTPGEEETLFAETKQPVCAQRAAPLPPTPKSALFSLFGGIKEEGEEAEEEEGTHSGDLAGLENVPRQTDSDSGINTRRPFQQSPVLCSLPTSLQKTSWGSDEDSEPDSPPPPPPPYPVTDPTTPSLDPATIATTPPSRQRRRSVVSKATAAIPSTTSAIAKKHAFLRRSSVSLVVPIKNSDIEEPCDSLLDREISASESSLPLPQSILPEELLRALSRCSGLGYHKPKPALPTRKASILLSIRRRESILSNIQ